MTSYEIERGAKDLAKLSEPEFVPLVGGLLSSSRIYNGYNSHMQSEALFETVMHRVDLLFQWRLVDVIGSENCDPVSPVRINAFWLSAKFLLLQLSLPSLLALPLARQALPLVDR